MAHRYHLGYVLMGLAYGLLVHSAPYMPPQFYRAAYMTEEPRIDRDWMSSLEFQVATGSTRKAFDGCEYSVPLLDIYGLQNFHDLGEFTTCMSPTNPIDLIVTQLALTPGNPPFGIMSLSGKFSLIEAVLGITQTFKYGFFFQANIPFSRFKVNSPCFCDLTPLEGCPNRSNPMWQTFLENFPTILTQNNLSITPYTDLGFGDVSLLAGWTHSFTDSDLFDFFDVSGKAGVILPTSKKHDPYNVLFVSRGYDGHLGVPFIIDLALGNYEWLVFGGSISGIAFGDKTRCIRPRSSITQSGIFYLDIMSAHIHRDALWNICWYVKADHALRGLSLLFGYTYTAQGKSIITSCSCQNALVACTDPRFDGWQMHTLHFWGELDFTQKKDFAGPRVSAFYNFIIGGQRIFKTNMLGGLAGVDLLWKF